MSRGKDDRVRIISGSLKGRRISVLRNANIRPTGDRVKTTLFNWLAFELSGVRVLDLFAGTGALGLEALSRGAAHTTFVEKNRRVARQLQSVCMQLAIDPQRVHVVNTDAMRWLKTQKDTWDLVFVDPPYAEHSYYEQALTSVAPRLSEKGTVYVECSIRDEIELGGFDVWKQSVVGEVRMSLLRKEL